MRSSGRWVWVAAIVAPLVNQLLLTVADLSLYGAIPPEDYPFIVITVVSLFQFRVLQRREADF